MSERKMTRGLDSMMSAHRKWGWPAFILAAFLMCLLPVVQPAAGAAENEEPVEIVVQLGWDGWSASGRYTPAVITLKNTSNKDLKGIVEAVNYYRYTPPPPPGSPPGTVPPARDIPWAGFGEKVSLPAGAEKKITLWFPVQGPGSRVDIVFRDGDRELARINNKMPGSTVTGPTPLAVGVLGEAPPALERVRPLMPDGVYRVPKVKELTPDLFPRRGEYLDAFQTILVTAGGASSLSEEQKKALVQWAEMGGHVVICGGLDVERALTALPAGAIQVEVKQVEEQSQWQAEAAWLGVPAPTPAAVSVARLGGPGVSWGPENNGLGLQFQQGSGLITVLGFDPNQPPWRSGTLGEALWNKFLTPESAEKYYRYMPASYQLDNLIYQTQNLPGDIFPGWRPVGVYLLVFLLVAGPCTYLVLRRIKRPEYTWVAVPVLSVLFSAGIYLYMLVTGGNVPVNIIQAVDLREPGKVSAYTAVGFFAPTQREFTAVLDDPDLAVRVESTGGRPIELMEETGTPQYSVIRGSDLEVRFGDVSQWNMRGVAFRNDALAEKAGGLEATVQVSGESVTGWVRNGTGMQLDHVVLFWGSKYKMLGDLKPGEEKTLEMEVSTPSYNPQGYYGPEYPNMWQVFQYPDGPPTPSKPGDPVPPPVNRRLTSEEQRRADLASSWESSFRGHGPVESGWPLTVLAWSESPTGASVIKNINREPSYLTMFVGRPEIKLSGGSFTIPAGLIAPEMVDSQVRGMFGYNNLYGIDSGYLVFGFKPQLQDGVLIKNITVRFDCFPASTVTGGGVGPPGPNPAPVPKGVLEIYHPGYGSWVELAGAREFKLGGEYATASGEVRLRVTGISPEKGGFYFLPPTVEYGGESR